ncbi:MAG: hypothetical protein R2824_19745 [Saprospiraceae bacterium]|nr:hypothetical protein [Lewinella sp.]
MRNIILESKRLQSLELQIFLYLNFVEQERSSIEKIRKAFLGLASSSTIRKIVCNSSFFTFGDDDTVGIMLVKHKADITYDFEPDNPNSQLKLSGKTAATGKNKSLKGVTLFGIGYRLEVNVIQNGVGNWKLNIKKLEITDLGNQHQRKMESNPLHENGDHNRGYDTYRS